MNLTDKVIGMWCVNVPFGNVLIKLEGSEVQGTYLVDTRLRVYLDDKAHDSKDKRSGYQIIAKRETEEEAIRSCRVLYEALQPFPSEENWELLRGTSTMGEFITRLSGMPGIHTKHISASELTHEQRKALGISPDGRRH